MREIWRKIAGYDNRYEVSNFGRIRSVNYKNSGRVEVLKPAIDKKGYYRTMLLDMTGRYRTVKVHRIVAETFIANLKNLPQVNHIDGDKANNRVDNLEWVTNYENAHHALDNGLFQKSIETIQAANDKRKTPIIAVNLATGEEEYYQSYSDARRATGVSKIHMILRGERSGSKGFSFKRG